MSGSRANTSSLRKAISIAGFFLAASNPAAAERLPLKIYTTADGLAHNNVQRIVRDSRGFLWFCTFEGLSRFDGYGFTNYGVEHGLPSQVINDLLETREGDYWVATGGGLCRFNPKGIPDRRTTIAEQEGAAPEAMFTVYFPGEDAASREVTSLLQDRAGVIWCGTARGLYRAEQRGGRLVFEFIDLGLPGHNPTVTSMIEDRRGTLWIASAWGIYRVLPEGSIEHYADRNGLPSSAIFSLLLDREGRIWAATWGGLCRLVSDPDPGGTVVARAYSEKDGLPTQWIAQVLQTSDGTLWAASNRGLIHFIPTDDGRDFRLGVYTQPNGLNSNDVQALAEDLNGNLWLGMGNGGAARLARSGITAFGEADGIKDGRAIFEDRAGNLNVTTYPDLMSRSGGGAFTAIRPGFPKKIYFGWGWNQLVLQDTAGEWWMATGAGLYRFPKVSSIAALEQTRPKAVYTVRDGLSSNQILRLFEDSRGDIWVGAANPGGLSRWDRAAQSFRHYSEKDGLPSLSNFYPISFAEDRTGGVWIGFNFRGGLFRFHDGRFTRFDGLPEGGIFNLFIDSSGRLWVPTTRGGVCRIDHPEAEGPSLMTYTTADGLLSNDVKAVTEDRWGRIYLGTGRGIDRLDPATGHLRHYTANEGALLGDVLAALRDRDGALWFTCGTGLIRLEPEANSQPIPPPVLITALRIAGDPQRVSALGETEVAPLKLAAGKNQLQIDFVALGFSPGEGLRYQYKLEGGAQDWSPLSDQRAVNFANLAPGRYRFLVRAVTADGMTSEVPASFSFTILTPLWQSWWFVGAAALLAGLFVYSLYRYRLAQLLRLERVRTRIAADLHDDIGANLSKIAVLSEVAHHQLGRESRVADSTLSSIANISRESVASMRDIVWAVNPRRDRLFDLTRRMRGFASDIFTSRNIQFQFHAPERDRELKLGADVRRDVFLIFKEAVNNAVRHSACAKAAISLRVETGMLALVITDDGKGLGSVEDDEGQGISGMRRRAENFGGKLDIISHEGEGTTVRLLVPIGNRRWAWPRGDGAKTSGE
jgi:ligand-binding sensor domain-containing protein/two-component sensor histidine kinase